jgi:hypothetical protein
LIFEFEGPGHVDQQADEISVVRKSSEDIAKAVLQIVERGFMEDTGHFDDEDVCLKVVG